MPIDKPTLRQKLEFAGLSLGAWVVQRLPYPWLRHIANIMGLIAYAVDRRGREVSMANLTSAFGKKYTQTEKARIAKGSYQTFARTMLELVWSPNLNEQSLKKIAKIDGLDQACFSDPTRPVILLCLHASNFEWISQAMVPTIGPGILVAQKIKNPLLGPLFDKLRSSTGHQIIPQERSMLRMFKHLKAGGNFNLAVDLNLDPKEPSVIIDEFSGLKTCVTQMHAALALRTGAAIVPASALPLPDGTYHITYHEAITFPPEATPAEIAQQCWDVLKPEIIEHPELWLWSYKHWRFRPENDESGRYPFYANTAKRFDKKLAAS